MNPAGPGGSAADPAHWKELDREPVGFVSRSRARAGTAPAITAGDGSPLPSLRQRSVWLLLVFVALLQAIAWSRIDGYQIADSVEFMERARILVRGEQMVDAGAIRPFGFSTALLPFFLLADWFGLHDPRPILWAICLLQNLLGLALVFLVVRIGARLADLRTGIAAGLLCGSNPVFLQYSTQPVSGIAAGVCIALALEYLLERGSFRRSVAGGAWLGVALLMAYQSLAILLVFAGLILLRDRRRAGTALGGVLLGGSLGIAVQCVLDKLAYGRFGASLWNYVVQNVFSVLTSVALKVLRLAREHSFQALERLSADAAEFFYGIQTGAISGGQYERAEDLSVRGLQSPWFYLERLPEMLVWPVIGLLLLGLLRLARRPNWKAGFLFLALAANVWLLSNKGSKDFRLWLPLLPMLLPLCAYGGALLWGAVNGLARERGPSRVQQASTWLVLATALFMSLDALLALKTRQFAGYWRAIDWVNEHARASLAERAATAGGQPARLHVGSAYNWAVYMRESPLVELVKLPWQLNLWTKYTPAQKAADFAAIEELDVFLVHLPVLQDNLDLLAWTNAHFQVEAAFYDQETYESGLGAIFVLARRDGSPGARTFFDLRPPEDLEAIVARMPLGTPSHFVRADGTDERLVLLGFEYQEVPPEGLGWIRYHWTTPTGLSSNYTIVDRLTSPDERNAWQNNHEAAYGVHPTSTWNPGAVVSEGFLVVPGSEPFLPEGFFRPLGGPHRRGDLIPVHLWIALLEHDVGEVVRQRYRLSPAPPGEDEPLRRPADGSLVTPDGYEFSGDGLFKVGCFFLPVHPRARLADDGQPVPE